MAAANPVVAAGRNIALAATMTRKTAVQAMKAAKASAVVQVLCLTNYANGCADSLHAVIDCSPPVQGMTSVMSVALSLTSARVLDHNLATGSRMDETVHGIHANHESDNHGSAMQAMSQQHSEDVEMGHGRVQNWAMLREEGSTMNTHGCCMKAQPQYSAGLRQYKCQCRCMCRCQCMCQCHCTRQSLSSS
jgi:hypothetical protein